MDLQGFINFISAWVVPTLILLALLYAYFCKVNLFDTFVEGAKEGFEMSVKLIPFLVGMMVAIGLFRDSGAMELVSDALTPTQLIGIPAEVLLLPLYLFQVQCPGHY